MKNSGSLVIVLDDDQSVQEGLNALLRSVGLDVAVYGSGAELLAANEMICESRAKCIILDVRLPGRNGLDIQQELAERKIATPIIFISGHADVPMSVRAIKAGATEFLTKPFRDQDLLDAVYGALEKDRQHRAEAEKSRDISECYATLTERERCILAEVIAGRPNKQIAANLGLSEVTVKVHRGRVMKKMRARTLVDLVRMTNNLGSPRP